MLTIRLQRVGKRNQPSFRIVLAEKHRAAKKLAVEILGHYNPRSKEFGLKDPERLKYWISKHVEVSPTVHNLLIDKGLLPGEKVKAWKPKKRQSPESATGEKEESKDVAETKSESPAAEAQAPIQEAKAEEKPADTVETENK